MNITQIKNSWNQGYAKGKSGAHTNFTDEMAKKTVINRACKMFVNTSDDSDILVEAFNNSDKEPFEDRDLVSVDYEVKQEISENANTKEIDIKETEEKVIDVEPILTKNEIQQQTRLEGPGF
jgi:recombination protein RecT